MSPTQPKIPAPRYIGAYVGKCDFCGFDYQKQMESRLRGEDEKSVSTLRTGNCCTVFPLINDPWFGWLACEGCLTTAREAVTFCTYEKERLLAEFPDPILVKRSSGQLQQNWKILSDGYRRGTEHGDEVYVEVTFDPEGEQGKIVKTVPLSLIREWNRI